MSKKTKINKTVVISQQPKGGLTDVQVRVWNSRGNAHQPLELPKGHLKNYIDSQRMASRDNYGRPNWKKFATLPLVSFVDSETGEEVVYEKEENLPSDTTEIKSSTEKLIARLN